MSNATGHKSTKFFWNTYEVPRWPSEAPAAAAAAERDASEELFTIRHLKQGATGAVKTWPAAEVLLDYLVRRGGLRGVREKIADAAGDDAVLDMTQAAPHPDPMSLEYRGHSQSQQPPPTYNVVELGAGSGYLGVGLALALNREACLRTPFTPKVRVMCTDNDRATVKNMRHNVSQQPNRAVNKAVRVESLGWGDDVGGEKFSDAVRLQFRKKRKIRSDGSSVGIFDGEQQSQQETMNALDPGDEIIVNATGTCETVTPTEKKEDVTTESSATDNSSVKPEDPIRLLTHLIASDVLYGETTLGPLSSVISALKLRNPDIAVTLLLRERSPGAVANLKSHIEAKVGRGLESGPRSSEELSGFAVSVREVVHGEVLNMKMVEC